MKKHSLPLLLTFIILTLFTGCYNLSVDTGVLPSSENSAATDASGNFCCVVSGRVSTELDAAAMPASAARQVFPSGGSAASVRTALPSLNLTGEVAITAKFYDTTAGIPDVTGTYDTENKAFSVPLTKEGTWTIFATYSSYSGATTVTITRDTLVKNDIALKMKPDMSTLSGTGTISLPVSIEEGTGINKIAMTFTDSESTVHTPDITLISNSTTGTLNETGVAAGAYSATIRAYDTAGALVFQCTESLLVLPGETTNNWVISSADVTASPYLSVDEAGVVQFKITKACLENFARTSYYADPNGDDTEGDGSQGNPFHTLKKAADTIMLYNDGVSEYTLFIEDDITYSSAADAFSISLPADYTKDLKVKLTSLDGKYSINADGKTNVLKVTNSSDKKCILTVENIVLSGGKADSGAGIYFKGKSKETNANTKLILNSGAEIKDNDFIGTADVDGVGICVTNASFEMNDGSKIIGKNYSGNNLQKDWFMGGCLSLSYSKGIINGGEIRGVKISGCTKEIEGSAVYLGWSETTMYGGLITANQVTDSECIYGTLYVEAGLFTMDGGEISGNTLSGNGTVYGSGLYITDNTSSTTCILNKGSISNNLISNTDPSTDFGGAGIFSLGSSLTINGSFKISNNFVIGSSGKGGAIYHGAGNLVINGGTFYGNFAEKGGGLYNGRLVREDEISATISGGYFFANTATFGHGMFVSEYGSATLQGSPVFSKADYIYLQETGDDTVKTLDIGGALCTKPGYTSVATIIVNNYKEGMTVLTGPGVSSANSLFSLYDSTFGIDTEGKLKKYP